MKQFSFLFYALTIFLTGCHLFKNEHSIETSTPETIQSISEEKTRPFPKDTLSALLIAEFSEHRGKLENTLAIYVVQAQKTKDPKVIKRAYQIASYLENTAERLNMAMLWVNIEPKNLEANRAAFIELSKSGMRADTAPYLEEILVQTKELDFLLLQGNPFSVESYSQLIRNIDQQLIKYPNNEQLLYTKAFLLSETKAPKNALSLLEKLPAKDQQQNDVILLRSYLLQTMGKPDEAFALLNKEIKNTPQNKQLRLNLAQRLISDGNLSGAKQQFLALNQQYPNDEEIRFGLALICLEMGNWDEATRYFNTMLDKGVDKNIIYFYLGSAYDKKGDKEKALNFYQQVNGGENFLASIASSAKILFEQNKIKEAQQLLAKARQDQPVFVTPLYLFEVEELQNANKLTQAWQIINQAIKAEPKNTSFYYSRALLAEHSNNIAQAEKDLRYVIKLDPTNDSAINALGYILTDRTKRYGEALKLIQQALSLNPNNPATLDSMGWLYYKRGKLEEAQEYLQQAYDNYPDPDVAAHLGEVLWKQGHKEQAKAIWSKALEDNPNNTLLLQTIKRLTGSKEL